MIQESETQVQDEMEASTIDERQPDLVIDDNNFHEYFFDVRMHKPQRGQIMAVYTAMASLVNGREKENLVDLLMQTTKVRAATQVMRKLFHACEEDAIRVPKRIVEDLISGMSREQVLEKPYEFRAELYFYTKKEYVPPDDPHWSIVSIVNLDDYLTKKGDYVISTKRIPSEQPENDLPENVD